jgi:hypothetical protein
MTTVTVLPVILFGNFHVFLEDVKGYNIQLHNI